MKKTAFSLKSLMVMGMIVWSMAAHAQYDVAHGQVYYRHEPVKYADARSFVDLGYGYAKDRNNVYLNGRVLELVDPATFRLKKHSNQHPHETRGNVHEHGKEHRGYHKTQFNVYYGDKKLDATPATFKELGGGYAKDAFNVFYYGRKVEGASAATFKYTNDGYAKDAFNNYYRGRKLE